MPIDRNDLVLAGILSVLVAIFVMGVWLPYRYELSEKTQILSSDEEQLRLALTNLRNSTTYDSGQSDERLSQAEIDLAIPVGSELGSLLTQIGEDLHGTSVTERQLQARAVVLGEDFNRIPLTLQFKATYTAFFNFLQRLELRQRIIRIDRLGVRREVKDTGDSVVVDIELSTFFRPLPEDMS